MEIHLEPVKIPLKETTTPVCSFMCNPFRGAVQIFCEIRYSNDSAHKVLRARVSVFLWLLESEETEPWGLPDFSWQIVIVKDVPLSA